MKNDKININTSSEDLLLVENLDKNEYVVTAAVIEPPIEKKAGKKKKITTFGAIFSALSVRKSDKLYSNIRPTRTLNTLILILIFTILLYFFYQVADIKLILGIIVFFGAIAAPLLLILLSYELCPQKNIKLFHVFVSFLFGVLLFLSINSLSSFLLAKNIYPSSVETVLVPIMWGFGEFIFIAILSRMYDITDFSIATLLAVSVGMGYATTATLQSLINSLFIPVELILESSIEHYVGTAIVDNLILTQLNIIAVLPDLIYQAFYYPICIASWSVLIGMTVTVPSITKERNFAIYLLIVLVISLYMLANFTTSYKFFNVAIKMLALAVSVITAIRFTNNNLNLKNKTKK